MAQSTPMTMPMAMQAIDIQIVLTRPRMMEGQMRNSRVVAQSICPSAKALTRSTPTPTMTTTAVMRP